MMQPLPRARTPGAIVYLAQKRHSSYGRDSLGLLTRSLRLLFENYNSAFGDDVLIFHEGDFTSTDQASIIDGRAPIRFARLPTRPVNYWLVGSDVKKEGPKKEEPKEEEAKAAAPGLAVDVDAATGAGAAPLVSPGFKELLETPRAADGADGGATSSPLAGFKGSTPRDGGAKGAAVPSGRRAAAHAEGVDGDIEIDIGASGGKRLSLGDYKRRTSGA